MAIYNRNDGNLPEVRKPTQVANKELGDIIIKSFETVTEALSDDDVPVNPKQIEDAIVKGINRSRIGKSGGTGGTTPGPESNFEKYYNEKRLDLLKKREQAIEQEEKNAIKERESKIKEKVDKTFNELSQWTSNPLKAFSDSVDKGIKSVMTKVFGGGEKLDKGSEAIVNSTKDLGKLLHNPLMELVTSAKAIGQVVNSKSSISTSSSGINLDDLISESNTSNTVINTAAQAVSGTVDKAATDAMLAEQAATAAATTGALATTATATTATAASTAEVVAPVAGILAAVGTVAFFLPTIVGGIANLINHSDIRSQELKVHFNSLLHGPYSIFTQMKNSLLDALGSVTVGGKKIFGTSQLTDEQQERFTELGNKQGTFEHQTEEMDKVGIDDLLKRASGGNLDTSGRSLEDKYNFAKKLQSDKNAWKKLSFRDKTKLDNWIRSYDIRQANVLSDEEASELSYLEGLAGDAVKRDEMLKLEQAKWKQEQQEQSYIDLLKQNRSKSDYDYMIKTGRISKERLATAGISEDFNWAEETGFERVGRKGDTFNRSLGTFMTHLSQNIWTGIPGASEMGI